MENDHQTPLHRRNSFDQPFSPLLGSDPFLPSNPIDSSGGTGRQNSGSKERRLRSKLPSIPRGRPSVLQLVTLAMAGWALWRTYSPSPSLLAARITSTPWPQSPRRPSPLHNPSGVLGLSSIVVGPRFLKPQYYRTPGSCNSTELLRALSLARIRPDGASRHVEYSIPVSDFHTLSSFKPSFDLSPQGCAEPHLYTPEEACDLLQAFGGMMLRGDSFVRHVVNALFILLTGRESGAVEKEGERCRGNAMFDDRKAHCREMSVTNSQAMASSVCGGEAFIFFELNSWGAQPPHLLLSTYDLWRSSLPAHKQILSHAFISGFGLHHHLNSLTAIQGFIKPFLSRSAQIFPKPVGIWMGIHAPAEGKPERWRVEQGEENVKRYNREVGEALEAQSPGEFGEEGVGMKQVEWYNVTEGAESYDGSHYSYQVNMEKALILLNLLDTIWGEAVEAGGLLETF
ncbi:hypothetical protein JCM11641_004777 [Rhodosporidiobolus odoratus]